MKRDKDKLTRVLAKKPTIHVGRFADDDAKAAARKKISDAATLTVTRNEDGVEVWTVRKKSN